MQRPPSASGPLTRLNSVHTRNLAASWKARTGMTENDFNQHQRKETYGEYRPASSAEFFQVDEQRSTRVFYPPWTTSTIYRELLPKRLDTYADELHEKYDKPSSVPLPSPPPDLPQGADGAGAQETGVDGEEGDVGEAQRRGEGFSEDHNEDGESADASPRAEATVAKQATAQPQKPFLAATAKPKPLKLPAAEEDLFGVPDEVKFDYSFLSTLDVLYPTETNAILDFQSPMSASVQTYRADNLDLRQEAFKAKTLTSPAQQRPTTASAVRFLATKPITASTRLLWHGENEHSFNNHHLNESGRKKTHELMRTLVAGHSIPITSLPEKEMAEEAFFNPGLFNHQTMLTRPATAPPKKQPMKSLDHDFVLPPEEKHRPLEFDYAKQLREETFCYDKYELLAEFPPPAEMLQSLEPPKNEDPDKYLYLYARMGIPRPLFQRTERMTEAKLAAAEQKQQLQVPQQVPSGVQSGKNSRPLRKNPLASVTAVKKPHPRSAPVIRALSGLSRVGAVALKLSPKSASQSFTSKFSTATVSQRLTSKSAVLTLKKAVSPKNAVTVTEATEKAATHETVARSPKVKFRSALANLKKISNKNKNADKIGLVGAVETGATAAGVATPVPAATALATVDTASAAATATNSSTHVTKHKKHHKKEKSNKVTLTKLKLAWNPVGKAKNPFDRRVSLGTSASLQNVQAAFKTARRAVAMPVLSHRAGVFTSQAEEYTDEAKVAIDDICSPTARTLASGNIKEFIKGAMVPPQIWIDNPKTKQNLMNWTDTLSGLEDIEAGVPGFEPPNSWKFLPQSYKPVFDWSTANRKSSFEEDWALVGVKEILNESGISSEDGEEVTSLIRKLMFVNYETICYLFSFYSIEADSKFEAFDVMVPAQFSKFCEISQLVNENVPIEWANRLAQDPIIPIPKVTSTGPFSPASKVNVVSRGHFMGALAKLAAIKYRDDIPAEWEFVEEEGALKGKQAKTSKAEANNPETHKPADTNQTHIVNRLQALFKRHLQPLYNQCQSRMGGGAAVSLRPGMKDWRVQKAVYETCEQLYRIFNLSCKTVPLQLQLSDLVALIESNPNMGTTYELMILVSLSRNLNLPTVFSWACFLEFSTRAAQAKYPPKQKGDFGLPTGERLTKFVSDLSGGAAKNKAAGGAVPKKAKKAGKKKKK